MSSGEAELRGMGRAASEAIYLRQAFSEVGVEVEVGRDARRCIPPARDLCVL